MVADLRKMQENQGVSENRIDKRRLTLMKKKIQEKSDTFQEFFAIRAKAEGLS